MVCNGCRYRIKKLDEIKKTSYCGISAVFEVTNVSYRSDRHPELSEIDTMGIWKIFYSVTLNPSRQFCSLSTNLDFNDDMANPYNLYFGFDDTDDDLD